MSSSALGVVVVLLVLLALPIDGSVWRLAGGAAAVVVTRSWPVRSSVLTGSGADAARNLAFARAFVAGALLAEVAYVAWRIARDREAPLR